MELEERKRKEIEHSNRRGNIVTGYVYLSDTVQAQQEDDFVTDREQFEKHFSNTKFYSITRSSFAYRDQALYESIDGATALDYCCGNGEVGIEMAQKGAHAVFGIDISEVVVENATSLAISCDMGDRCTFKVMDAEHTDFEENAFDVIHEYGALHHLELKAALKELARILKPDGKVVCTEGLRHNPFIHLYRKKTLHLRTGWEVEHILGVPEIRLAKQYFKEVHVKFFHLAAIAAVPFRKTFLFRPLLSMLEVTDSVILRIPYVRRMAWVAVLILSKPKK